MGKADLHLHTTVSDGLVTVERLLEYVEHETDLDVIAVTDHEDALGGLRARELAAKRGYRVEVIPGAEVTTLQGHLLALFVENAPKSFRTVERTLEGIHEQGGLAIIPHPMSWLTRSLGRRVIERVVSRGENGVHFDGIELCNPSPAGLRGRQRACEGNLRWGLPAIGASDAHHLEHIGRGWTEFDGTTAEDLRSAIERGETRARMARYPSLREVGLGRTALGLVWGYSATPRKMLRWRKKGAGK